MKVATAVRRGYRKYKQFLYEPKRRKGEPLEFAITDDLSIRLYPAGHVAELLFTESFENQELKAAAAFLKPGMQVFDIGANIGLYSITAAKRIGASGRVLAFEPSIESYERLRRNLELNHVTTVSTIKIALTDRHGGELTLKRDPGFRDGDRFLTADAGSAAGGDTESVPITTLDRYVADNGIDRIDFLKIDIEGGELAVFKGGSETLKHNKDIVMMFECTRFACERTGHTQDDVIGLLRGMGFGVHAWNSASRRWDDDIDVLKKSGNLWATRDPARLP
jgi:FkbM family methyltransferase